MRRQETMKTNLGTSNEISFDLSRINKLSRFTGNIKKWISKQPHVEVLYISYEDLVTAPITEIEKISAFLGTDATLIKTASEKIDHSLYRTKKITSHEVKS